MCMLPNYRHLPRKNINKLGVSSENEPSRIQRVNVLNPVTRIVNKKATVSFTMNSLYKIAT